MLTRFMIRSQVTSLARPMFYLPAADYIRRYQTSDATRNFGWPLSHWVVA